MKYSKMVLLPIEVSEGDYCWNGKVICGYFNNEGGWVRCELWIGDPIKDKNSYYYRKPEKCRQLKEIKS